MWYQSLGFQMARRGREDFFVCRFADRGNNKVIFRPRAHGKDQLSTHRFAVRGSDGIDPDPWDFEIKRLHKRVEDIKVSFAWKETILEALVRDELTGDKKSPASGEIFYDSPSMYDEYDDDEWYLWATGGDIECFEEHVPYTISFGMLDSFPKNSHVSRAVVDGSFATTDVGVAAVRVTVGGIHAGSIAVEPNFQIIGVHEESVNYVTGVNKNYSKTSKVICNEFYSGSKISLVGGFTSKRGTPVAIDDVATARFTSLKLPPTIKENQLNKARFYDELNFKIKLIYGRDKHHDQQKDQIKGSD